MLRHRVLEPPGRLATPRWTVDDRFDLTWHLRRIDSPAPHTPDTVIAFARNAAMTAFDRSYPLWEFTLVEQLEGGPCGARHEAAPLAHRRHRRHATRAAALRRRTHARPSTTPEADAPADERLGTGDLIRVSLVRDWERAVGARTRSGTQALPGRAAFRPSSDRERPRRRRDRALDRPHGGAGARHALADHEGHGASVDTSRCSKLRLDDLTRAAAAAGGTVNDAFMAAVTGGLRRYHDRHGAPVDELRVTMPISIRRPDDPIGGNRITLMRFVVPVSDPDPASRIRAIGAVVPGGRNERSLAAHERDRRAAQPDAVGSGRQHAQARRLPRERRSRPDVPRVPGRRRAWSATSAFGPTTGSSVNLTLLSYDGTCCVGVTIDTAAVPDPDVLVECLREGFEEVLCLGRRHHERVPLRRASPRRLRRRPAA